MPSTRQNTSVIMALPHFPIQGQRCFQDEQPGHGEPCHEKSAGDSASHREIERKGGWTCTVTHVSCSDSSHFNFSLVLPIVLDLDVLDGFSWFYCKEKNITVQLLCNVPAS